MEPGFQPVPTPTWFRSAGPDSDVVISTRYRLARNLEEYPFPTKANASELELIAKLCRQALTNLYPLARRYDRETMQAETFLELTVGRYISLHWAASLDPGCVFVDPEGFWSAMINEEDHLRLQAVVGGFDPALVEQTVDGIVRRTSQRLRLAYRNGIGYLTSSLSNTGTGARLSFLLHMPVLASAPGYLETLSAAEQMGCSVRGAFGEDTYGTGGLVQLSNRWTYGRNAEHSTDRAVGAARYLIQKEREARGALLARLGGRSDLREACEGAEETLLRGNPDPAEMLRSVSVLRLGMALGVTSGDILRTGEWISTAGVVLLSKMRGGSMAERFAEVRALARIRAGLRQRGGLGGVSDRCNEG